MRGRPPALDEGPAGLVFDGCSLAELAAEHGTPLWVVSRTTLEENYARFAGAFRARYPSVDVAYSMKSNNTLAIVRTLVRAGAKLDCSSEHEIQLALRCGVEPGGIVVNGNGKSDGTLEACARLGVLQVNVDSLGEVARLERLAAALGTTVDCAVRVQLTYRELLEADPSFESTLRVGEGKFGSNVANGDALRTVAALRDAEHLRYVGLHHHVGFSGYMGDYTPEREVMHHRECTREICGIVRTVERELGLATERLDLGGGFRGGDAIYLSTPGDGTDGALHPLPAVEDYAEAIAGTIEAELPDARPALLFETGGYQVANAAVFLARVVEVKPSHGPDPRDVVTVDGSMQMFTSKGTMRVASEVVAVERPAAPRASTADVVGQTCVYDALAEAVPLPELAAGDLLALLNHGAYCDATGTQMNAFPRPATVMAHDGRAALVRRRETLEDVAGRDAIPDDLWDGG